MAGIVGRPYSRPTPAKPLGEGEYDPVSAPKWAGIGLDIPERGDLDATAAFDLNETELEDEPDDLPLTPRQMRAP